jgi:hypothetical protein
MGTGVTALPNSWYHVFAAVINNNVDFFFDTIVTAPNAPAGTSAWRRIGSIATDSNAHVWTFYQNGDKFIWPNGMYQSQFGGLLPGNGLTFLVGLSTHPSVPPGVMTEANFFGQTWVTGGSPGQQVFVTWYNPILADGIPIGPGMYAVYGGPAAQLEYFVFTDTSQRVKMNTTCPSGVSANSWMWVKGYTDNRGKDWT